MAMNVDEAIAFSQFSKAMTLSKLDLAEVAEVLANEVQRLRAELANLQKRYDEEIGSYEDEDPRSIGWVGSDGLP